MKKFIILIVLSAIMATGCDLPEPRQVKGIVYEKEFVPEHYKKYRMGKRWRTRHVDDKYYVYIQDSDGKPYNTMSMNVTSSEYRCIDIGDTIVDREFLFKKLK